MKKLFFILALLLPIVANAVKIKTDEIDEFSGKRTVITSWEAVANTMIHIRFRYQNDNQYLDFKFVTNSSFVIPDKGELLFKSSQGNTTEFNSVKMYAGSVGGGATGLAGSQQWGISATYKGDLEWFKDNDARLLRVYETDGYVDKKISESEGRNLKKLYELFNATINGESGKSVFANYNLTFVKRGINKKEWDVVKEEYKRDMSTDEINTLVNEWKSQSNDKVLYDVKIKKEK